VLDWFFLIKDNRTLQVLKKDP